MHTLSFKGLGTIWTISLDHLSIPPNLSQDLETLVTNFENQYSRFKPDSEITRLKTQSSPYPLSSDLEAMLALGLKLQTLTFNHFNLNLENLISGLGYNSEYSFTSNPSAINQPLSAYQIKDHQLIFDDPPSLDLGSLGKGYLIDKISTFLRAQNLTHFLIDGGGDIFATNKTDHSPWKIGVEHPLDQTQVIATVSLQNQSIATSSSNKRKFKDFHHLINPITKKPSQRLLSVSVLASKAVVADALSTAIFVSPSSLWDVLVAQFNLEYLLIYPDLQLKKTPAFTVL